MADRIAGIMLLNKKILLLQISTKKAPREERL
jgi:hypothetical protein